MNLDSDNSSNFQVIRDKKATDRTIGVMTKADLLPTGGDHQQWIKMLNREPGAYSVGLGYYITAQPRDLTMEDARGWEEAFFSH